MTEEKPKNLVTKLCEVTAAVGRVPKNGWNDFHKYWFAQEADVVEAVRSELSSRNVFIWPTILEHKRESKVSDKGGYLTDIMVEWMFVDGDTGESRSVHIPGCGEDKGDKGVYKAFTGSEKYMLTKCFLIPTGDDPENDGTPPAPPSAQQPQGRQYKLQNPSTLQGQYAPQPTAAAPPSNGDETYDGVVGPLKASEDGKCWFLSIGSRGTKGNGTVWTRNPDLAESLAKSQGVSVSAHMRSKKPGSYQIISFLPI